MNSYTTEVDKLGQDYEHLEMLTDRELDEDTAQLALSVAKRVRRQSNLVVRAIARHIDNSYSPGGTSE
jgi:hypothetical protein